LTCTDVKSRGPYRLARTILTLLDQTLTASKPSNRDAGTQSPPTLFPENGSSTNGIETASSSIKTPRQSPDTSIVAQLNKSEAEAPESTPSELSTQPTTKVEDFNSQTLPIRPKDVQAEQTPVDVSPPTRAYVGPPDTTPLRILAVDDNAVNLHLIHRYLQKRKDDIIVDATNGLEAVTAVKESEEPFDVVFMDISMPVMDGFEATRNIRVWENMSSEGGEDAEDKGGDESTGGSVLKKKRNRAYVVAMTGLGSQRDRDEADRSGFDDFMTKPVKLPMVGRLLKKLSEKKAAREMVGLGVSVNGGVMF
jgi:CheY-like chemotaxis protein